MKRGFIKKNKNAYLATTRLPRLRLAMTGVRGFTLIELLVVVLIIGILAAVALPQYQVSVAKSRLVKLIPAVRSLKDTVEMYCMANGSYPGDVNDLNDIGWWIDGCVMQGGGWCRRGDEAFDIYTQGFGGRKDAAGIILKGKTVVNSYGFYFDNTNKKGITYCGANIDNPTADAVCKNLGGKTYTRSSCTVATALDSNTCNIYELP